MSVEKEYEDHNHYNSFLSSTHTFNGTRIRVPFLNAQSTGFTSQDHVSLGGVVAKDQLFAEALTIHRGGDTDGIYIEAFLGLGARDGNSTMETENIVTALHRKGKLDENMLVLTLPYNEGDEGELILGGMSEDVDEQSIKWVPVSNNTFIHIDCTVHSSWQVSASAVTIGDETLINSTTSANTTAWIETESPLLGLPHEMADDIHTLIGTWQIG